MNKIFDLKNIDDLPDDIRQNLFPRSIKRKILELFDLQEKLTINKIKVGLYRQYGLKLTNGCISVHLSLLKRKGILNNVERGVWAKV
jgi:hypothetical protein